MTTGKTLCACAFFFSAGIEMQLQLKITAIIKYVERMRTGVKIELTNLYFFLFLPSCFQMLHEYTRFI